MITLYEIEQKLDILEDEYINACIDTPEDEHKISSLRHEIITYHNMLDQIGENDIKSEMNDPQWV